MPQKKHLILTYGVSEGRQRTVVLSLPRVNAFLMTLSVMAVWSLGSVVYLVSAGFRTEAVVQATPAPEQNVVAEAVPSAVEALPPASVEPPPEVEQPVAEVAPEPVKPVEAAPVAAPVAPVAPVEPELAAVVENYRATEKSGKLFTTFGIRNLSRATLRGKVVGDAEFVAEDGTVKTVTAQQDYKARTLSTKELAFAAPGPGKFTKVRITVKDQATQRAVVFFK